MPKPSFVPAPMEALLAVELPEGGDWQFEPKWDGFRCLARRSNAEVTLTSKSGKPLGRYFPDIVKKASDSRNRQCTRRASDQQSTR